ncbi:MAG TPA: mannose-6-phosphate isomerase, class I [Anaeromyxobacter sp.]|nr:mannose-6-phosphate isomerase, class I [Anaeromyxobacter sp.]
MDLLENAVQPYAWGSRTAIAELRGEPIPSPGPQAELWMGAHPLAPSRIVRGGVPLTLIEAVARSPTAELGPRALAEHGPQLPFLLKVLAADEPLSLQAHPDARQAREGFDREEAAGLGRDAPHRSYRDPLPKPELLCALTSFDALCGFRPAVEAAALLEELGPALAPVRERLLSGGGAEGLRAAFTFLATLPASERQPVVEAAARAAARARPGPFADAFALTGELAVRYPGDPGVVIALLLRLLHLSPGQALYLAAGSLHAYLHGVGVEIMASSDNVLRGGLTPKHVDVPELLRVLRFTEETVPLVAPRAGAPGELIYETPARHFELSRISPPESGFQAVVIGPEILLCTGGVVTAVAGEERLDLRRGASAFVPAVTGRYRLDGAGVAFRASLPRHSRSSSGPP